MYNSRASGSKVVRVRHGVHDWSPPPPLPVPEVRQKELTRRGCQLLQRRQRGTGNRQSPELVFNLVCFPPSEKVIGFIGERVLIRRSGRISRQFPIWKKRLYSCNLAKALNFKKLFSRCFQGLVWKWSVPRGQGKCPRNKQPRLSLSLSLSL